MKVLCFAVQKGGTGKTALSVQFAYYASQLCHLRVLVLDLDHQGNATAALTQGGYATVSDTGVSTLFHSRITEVESAPLLLLPAEPARLRRLDHQSDKHNVFASNLKASLMLIAEQFDLCIIDVNPNPDIRQLSALVVSDFVASPIQMAQESIDGIGDMLNDPIIGLRRIQATINPQLQFLGLLPNLVEPTNFQRQNFRDLARHFGQLLITVENNYAVIRKSTAIFEAQAAGKPLWEIKKTTARDTWKQIRPVFKRLLALMALQPREPAENNNPNKVKKAPKKPICNRTKRNTKPTTPHPNKKHPPDTSPNQTNASSKVTAPNKPTASKNNAVTGKPTASSSPAVANEARSSTRTTAKNTVITSTKATTASHRSNNRTGNPPAIKANKASPHPSTTPVTAQPQTIHTTSFHQPTRGPRHDS